MQSAHSSECGGQQPFYVRLKSNNALLKECYVFQNTLVSLHFTHAPASSNFSNGMQGMLHIGSQFNFQWPQLNSLWQRKQVAIQENGAFPASRHITKSIYLPQVHTLGDLCLGLNSWPYRAQFRLRLQGGGLMIPPLTMLLSWPETAPRNCHLSCWRNLHIQIGYLDFPSRWIMVLWGSCWSEKLYGGEDRPMSPASQSKLDPCVHGN